MRRFLVLSLVSVVVLAGCGGARTVPSTMNIAPVTPIMRWDHRAESDAWTAATLAALRSHGAVLVSTEPADIAEWCPGYAEAKPPQRRAFWSGLLSALAKYESTWNPKAVGGGGLWIGLVQIDPRTAKGYGCVAQSPAALKDGAANLSCAVRIAAHQVPKRGTVARGMRDWGPFHFSDKRAAMAAWTRSQAYCAK